TIDSITDETLKAANAQYAAANAKYTEANAAVTAAAAELRALDATVYNAANTYFTAINTENSSFVAAEKEKSHADLSVLKELYDADVLAIAKITADFDKVTEEAKLAKDEYTAAAAEFNNANKAANDAIKAVRDQINRITATIVPRLNYYVSEMLKTLSDSNYANEVIGGSNDYSKELKDDLKASNIIVVETEAKIHELSDNAMVAAKHALETASKIIEISTELKDPYAPAADEDEDDKDEGDEADEEDEYEYTKYTDDSGNIVAVGYSGGVKFIINYNYFAVTTEYNGTSYTLPAYGGIRVNSDGTTVEFTTNFNGGIN
ncbi:MAG: hypothetical protein MJ137_09290, partial [Clostridia bacterium]|nr:hypothetical protein [Clostridia bacterium]